jgi:tetratricopeptide (TPR) repeat protein
MNPWQIFRAKDIYGESGRAMPGLQENEPKLLGPRGAARWIRLHIIPLICFLALIPAASFGQMDPDLQQALKFHTAENQLSKAIELYTKVITANPQSAEAHNWRGMAYDDLGKLDKALEDFNKALEIAPGYADAYNNRGEVYRQKGELEKALQDYKKATYHEDDFAEPHYNMGLIYEKMGKNNLAADEYTEYLKLTPDPSDKKEIEKKISALTGTPGQKPGVKTPEEKKPSQKRVAGGKRPDRRPKPRTRSQVRPKRPQDQRRAPAGFQKRSAQMPGMPGMPGQGPANPEAFMAMMLSQYMPPELADPMAKVMVGVGTASPAVVMGASLLFYLIWSLMLFLMAKKTNTELAWMAFVPIAQYFLMVKVADKPWWWGLIIILVPIVNIIFFILVSFALAKARRKHWIWGLLLIIPCANPVAWLYLGLSK